VRLGIKGRGKKCEPFKRKKKQKGHGSWEKKIKLKKKALKKELKPKQTHKGCHKEILAEEL